MEEKENVQMQTQEENENNRIPAYGEFTQQPSEGQGKKAWKIIGCIALGVVIFLLGILTQWLIIEPEMRALILVKNKIDNEYYEEISDEEFYGAIFDTVNNRLLDAYSAYMTADEFASSQAESAGNRSGLGLVFYVQDGKMQISRVCGNSPAERAKILAGEYVVGFGASETELIRSESFDEFSAFLENYAQGQTFTLLVKGINGKERQVSIAKAAYVESYVFYRTCDKGYSFTTGDSVSAFENGTPISILPADTGYIRLLQFDGNASAAFAQAMQLFRAQGKKNLVLDMRGNGGGALDVVQELAKYFCKNATERNPIAVFADYGDKKVHFAANANVYGEYFSADSRICVLADEGSASATECLIGCMLSYGAISYADICLTEKDGVAKTYGKGIMQTTYYLDIFEKNAVRLTTAKILWPNGTCIHGRGILAQDGTKTAAQSYDGERELNDAIATLFP